MPVVSPRAHETQEKGGKDIDEEEEVHTSTVLETIASPAALKEQEEAETKFTDMPGGEQVVEGATEREPRSKWARIMEARPNMEERKPFMKSYYLREGESHCVWLPGSRTSQLASVVDEVTAKRARLKTGSFSKSILRRVRATQAALKEQNEALAREDDEAKKHVTFKLSAPLKLDEQESKQPPRHATHFYDTVSRYMASMQATGETAVPQAASATVGTSGDNVAMQSQQQRLSPGLVTVQKWKEVMRERQRQAALQSADSHI